MGGILTVVAGDGRPFQVERHFAHTVDGIVGLVLKIDHTVTGALHHHSAAKDAAEIGTLDGVHDAAGIARHHTVLNPILRLGLEIRPNDGRLIFEQHQQLVLGQGGTWFIGGALVVGTLLLALVFDFVVVLLAGRKLLVVVVAYLILDVVVVGAVVGDIQLAVAVDKGQVAVAVQTAGVARADGDEVAVVGIVDGGGGIAEDSIGVGKHLTAHANISAGEDGIADEDAALYKFAADH